MYNTCRRRGACKRAYAIEGQHNILVFWAPRFIIYFRHGTGCFVSSELLRKADSLPEMQTKYCACSLEMGGITFDLRKEQKNPSEDINGEYVSP